MSSPPESVRPLRFRARLRAPSAVRAAPGLERCSAGTPTFRRSAYGHASGSLRFPGGPSRSSALLQDPARTGTPRRNGFPGAAPAPNTAKASARHDFEAHDTALLPAVYASRAPLPPPMQDSLPAGGLRLCREGVEPSGSRSKGFRLHSILLSRT